MNRRTRTRLVATSGVAVAVALAGCGSSKSTPASSSTAKYTGAPHSTTLKLAYTAADPPLDPATYYGGPAFNIMDGIYDGLVKYEVGGVKIEPDIAQTWTISPDGKTYTFNLKKGLTYHDGTPITAASIKFAFQRFINFKSSPSYMLAQVTSMDAPDASTFVMHLSSPVDPMLDYLASFVGPKAMSPTTVAAHAGKDNGATWLATHDAGSGPYELTSVITDQSYTLKAWDKYPGLKPYYTEVDVAITPDVTTQVLQLKKGDLDVISTALPANLVSSLQSDPNISVKTYPGLLKSVVWVKKTSGFLAQPGVAAALKEAIDRSIVTKGAYGITGTVSKDLDLLPIVGSGGPTDDNPSYDPSKLTALVKKAGGSPALTLGYLSGNAADKLAAELMQTELQATGLKVTLIPHGYEIFDFPTHPDKAPDLMLLSTNADAASSGTWLTEYYSSNGPLTLNGAKTPDADALLAKGITSATHAEAVKYYAEASKAYSDSGSFFTIADLTPTVIYRKSVGTIATTPDNPFGPMLDETRP